jgi:hypothetical protein
LKETNMSGPIHGVEVLERTQLAAATKAPLPRRVLGRGILALLIALRVYVFVAVPIVAYAFVHALLAAQ